MQMSPTHFSFKQMLDALSNPVIAKERRQSTLTGPEMTVKPFCRFTEDSRNCVYEAVVSAQKKCRNLESFKSSYKISYSGVRLFVCMRW